MTKSTRDAIGVEIFANLFKAVVDEMAWVVLRSSHTTFVKETQDFGVALVTPEGEMFAYPYGSGATPLMGVAMDTVQQVEAQLIMRHYDGFTPKSGRIRGRRSW